MPKKRIGVVAGDRGGLNALLPVLTLAIEQGHEVVALLTATCREQYDQGNLALPGMQVVLIEKEDRFAGEKLAQHNVNILLVAASQSEEGSLVACDCINGVTNIPIIGMEDMYGSLGPILEKCEDRFNSVCVIDEFASKLMFDRHLTLRRKIVVTGGPQFDQAIHVKKNWKSLRADRRSALKATNNSFVFLLVGGINGTAEMLDIVSRGIFSLNLSDNPPRMILRRHPRATPEDTTKTNVWLQQNETNLTKILVDEETSNLFSTDDWLPAVDFVFSGYSTVNHSAILHEIPGTGYLRIEPFIGDLWREKKLRRSPEIMKGAGWDITCAFDVVFMIQALVFDRYPEKVKAIRKAQREIAEHFDGKAAQRVWDETKRFLIPPL